MKLSSKIRRNQTLLGVPPAIANISPAKNSLLKSAARSISRYSASVNRRNVWGDDIARPNVKVSPQLGKKPVLDYRIFAIHFYR